MSKQPYKTLKMSLMVYDHQDVLTHSTEKISYFMENWIEDWEDTTND